MDKIEKQFGPCAVPLVLIQILYTANMEQSRHTLILLK